MSNPTPDPAPPLEPDPLCRDGLEITPRDAAAWVREGRILIDVREDPELAASRVKGATHLPMGIVLERLDDLDADPGDPIAVLCHHGVRSLKVTLAMHHIGWTGARSVAGGIDAWSTTCDPTVPRYTK